MNAKETSAYIKGIIEGANFDTTTTEGKIISALVELCDKMAEEIEELQENVETAYDYLEELDHDLGELEGEVWEALDEDCDCDCDCDDDDCDCCDCDCDDDDDCDCCDCCDCDCDDETELYCAMCPNCGGKVYFDDTVDPSDVICPACQTSLIEEEDEEV